jgi:uncharacterized membrane protein
MRENVMKRLLGATAGVVIGLFAGVYLNQVTGQDLALLTFVIGAPIAAVLARYYGGPISEAMGTEERGLTRNLKLALLAIGILVAGAYGALTGDVVNGVGLAFMILTVAGPRLGVIFDERIGRIYGPRLGVIFDERIGRIYGKSATVALAVFSLCASYVGFYQMALNPEQVTVGSFMLVIWISWASLVLSLVYYYFFSGE